MNYAQKHLKHTCHIQMYMHLWLLIFHVPLYLFSAKAQALPPLLACLGPAF